MRKFICTAALVWFSLTPAAIAQEHRSVRSPSLSDPFRLSIGTSFSASGGGGRTQPRLTPETVTSDFEEALAVIQKNYGGFRAIDPKALTSSSIAGMLKTLDPHSNYYNPDEFQELLGEHASEYTGTGTSMAGFAANGIVETYFLSAAPGSPAARAGIRFGDKLISIDGIPTTGREPDFARQMLRGRKGTDVSITVERADTRSVETLTVKRDRIHEPAVPEPFVFGDVAYIDLTNGFSNSTFSEFDAALERSRRLGVRSLIIDLRGNGGGILDQAIKVAERLLPTGSLIASQKGRYPSDERAWRSRSGRPDDRPVVLLVDERTASASEVLAGALQDNDRALIIGRRTFGKGLVQSVLNLPGGAGLTLTAARYFTPSGRSIQREYADTGLYDYYHHRGTIELGKPAYAAKTLTGRIIHGGDGIRPDEQAAGQTFTPARIGLLDPIFHFIRETLAAPRVIDALRRQAGTADPRISGSTDQQLVDQLERFVSSNPVWTPVKDKVSNERPFVADMLRYYLNLAANGPESAQKIAIRCDPQFKQAVKALPQAATLAAAAAKTRRPRVKQKSSPSSVLGEQR